MNTKTARNLGIRLDPQTSERLDRFETVTGVPAATLGRNAIQAALDYFATNGYLSFPLTVIPKSDYQPPSPELNARPANTKYEPKPRTRKT
ncbi:MAG: hypothetical protein JNJ83_11140 [Verrucomicrobiaceae bacterium]|nr:hypothetical protein [Verrucomicrobiaceae bacterium]